MKKTLFLLTASALPSGCRPTGFRYTLTGHIEGLNDSKKLSEKKREKLFDEITENALAWSVSLVDERVIDEINILQATFRAMRQA